MNVRTVYVLRDPDSGDYRYVGATQQPLIPTEQSKQRRSKSLRALYANNPEKLERQRSQLNAAREFMLTPEARAAASIRMKELWANPEKAREMTAAMQEGRKHAARPSGSR